MDLIALTDLARELKKSPKELRSQLRAINMPGILIERGARKKAYVDRDAMHFVDAVNAKNLAARVTCVEATVRDHEERLADLEMKIA